MAISDYRISKNRDDAQAQSLKLKQQIETLQEELELLHESNADVAPRRGRPKKELAVAAPVQDTPQRKKKRFVRAEEKARRSEAGSPGPRMHRR